MGNKKTCTVCERACPFVLLCGKLLGVASVPFSSFPPMCSSRAQFPLPPPPLLFYSLPLSLSLFPPQKIDARSTKGKGKMEGGGKKNGKRYKKG